MSSGELDPHAHLVDHDEVEWVEVISAYRRHYELSRGDRAARLRAEAEFWWAWKTVDEAVEGGSLPVAVVDALVCDPVGGSDYRGYVAAGPLEDLLRGHPAAYVPAFAEKARTSDAWAEALRGVWLDRAEWTALPEELRRLIPEPPVAEPDARRRPARR